MNDFISELPKNLAIEVSLFIHESTYKRIHFLRENASESFLAWICPLLIPESVSLQDYVYFEGDEAKCIYFMKGGECGFVLPRYSNIKYIDIEQGKYFGLIDILGSMLANDTTDFAVGFQQKDLLKRQFTVQ